MPIYKTQVEHVTHFNDLIFDSALNFKKAHHIQT